MCEMCMCEMCMCVCVCVCACMCRGPILWDTTFNYMHLCTEWMYFNSCLLIIAERGYKEYGREDFDDK